MSIEVILKEHVEHLGQPRRDRQGRQRLRAQLLFPRKLALAVTDENKRQIERERAQGRGARGRGARASRRRSRPRSRRSRSPIARRVGENETLYGSVTTADIADALAARELTVDRRKIQLADPLKTLGEHVVPVKLHRDVTAQRQGEGRRRRSRRSQIRSHELELPAIRTSGFDVDSV